MSGEYDIELVHAHTPWRAGDIQAFNDRFDEDFLPLTAEQCNAGTWILVREHGAPEAVIAFAGVVPHLSPFKDLGYFKRVGVLPDHRGKGIQRMLMGLLENVARNAGYSRLVSTTALENVPSSNNFVDCGWHMFLPDKPWEGETPTIYWFKEL